MSEVFKSVSCLYDLLNMGESGMWNSDGTIILNRPLSSSKLDKIKFRSFSANLLSTITNLTTPTLRAELCMDFTWDSSQYMQTTGDNSYKLYINNAKNKFEVTNTKESNTNNNGGTFVLSSRDCIVQSSITESITNAAYIMKRDFLNIFGIPYINNFTESETLEYWSKFGMIIGEKWTVPTSYQYAAFKAFNYFISISDQTTMFFYMSDAYYLTNDSFSVTSNNYRDLFGGGLGSKIANRNNSVICLNNAAPIMLFISNPESADSYNYSSGGYLLYMLRNGRSYELANSTEGLDSNYYPYKPFLIHCSVDLSFSYILLPLSYDTSHTTSELNQGLYADVNAFHNLLTYGSTFFPVSLRFAYWFMSNDEDGIPYDGPFTRSDTISTSGTFQDFFNMSEDLREDYRYNSIVLSTQVHVASSSFDLVYTVLCVNNSYIIKEVKQFYIHFRMNPQLSSLELAQEENKVVDCGYLFDGLAIDKRYINLYNSIPYNHLSHSSNQSVAWIPSVMTTSIFNQTINTYETNLVGTAVNYAYAFILEDNQQTFYNIGGNVGIIDELSYLCYNVSGYIMKIVINKSRLNNLQLTLTNGAVNHTIYIWETPTTTYGQQSQGRENEYTQFISYFNNYIKNNTNYINKIDIYDDDYIGTYNLKVGDSYDINLLFIENIWSIPEYISAHPLSTVTHDDFLNYYCCEIFSGITLYPYSATIENVLCETNSTVTFDYSSNSSELISLNNYSPYETSTFIDIINKACGVFNYDDLLNADLFNPDFNNDSQQLVYLLFNADSSTGFGIIYARYYLQPLILDVNLQNKINYLNIISEIDTDVDNNGNVGVVTTTVNDCLDVYNETYLGNLNAYLQLQTTDLTLKLVCDNFPTINNIVFYLNETSMVDFKEALTSPQEPNIRCRIIDANGDILTPELAANLYSNITICCDWQFYV